ncbi:MAG: ABC transporter substrate-binding protein [Caldilineaceae bacterium]
MKQPNLKRGNLFLTIILSCTLWLTACVAPTAQTPASGDSTATGATRTRLVIGAPSLPDILDGQQTYSGGPTSTELIGQALLRLDPETGELIPDLAESWSFSDDNLTLTITLPADALYSNGDPLDAQAVADALMRNKEVSPYASDFAALADAKAVDATTVELSFSEPPAAFLTVLNSSFGGPWDVAEAQKVGNEAFATAPVASGPLMVKEFTPGGELLLARNPNYQTNLPYVENKGPIHLEEVQVRVIPEELTLAGELETGSIDMIVGVPASAIERLRQNPEITVWEKQRPGIFGLVMNLERPLFTDVRVRQAIAQAVDRDALVKVLSGVVPAYTFVTPGMIAYSAEVDTYAQGLHPHDVAAAQALLADAGWSDSDGDGIVEKDSEPLAIEFLIATDATDQAQAAQVLQSQLKEIGIDLQINQQERNALWDTKTAGDFDMGFENYGWPDPDILSVVLGSDFWNHANFDNPAVMDELTKARYIMDPTERIAAYAAIQHQLLDDVIEIPLWQTAYYIAARNNVHDVIFPENYRLFLNDVTVTE